MRKKSFLTLIAAAVVGTAAAKFFGVFDGPEERDDFEDDFDDEVNDIFSEEESGTEESGADASDDITREELLGNQMSLVERMENLEDAIKKLIVNQESLSEDVQEMDGDVLGFTEDIESIRKDMEALTELLGQIKSPVEITVSADAIPNADTDAAILEELNNTIQNLHERMKNAEGFILSRAKVDKEVDQQISELSSAVGRLSDDQETIHEFLSDAYLGEETPAETEEEEVEETCDL